MELRNKYILVLGGGSGIGKAIAVRFIEAGAKVMITGKTEEKLQAVADEIHSPNLFYRCFDITDIEHHEELFQTCEEQMGGLNAFVNAAFFLMRNEINYMLDRNIRGNILNFVR